jgi:hypothetical protein
MATGSILLSPGAAILPDGSASNLAPAMQRAKSSAAAPSPYLLQLAFDGSGNTEQCMWSFRMPADYASAPVLKVQYKMASATSNSIVLDGRIAAVSDGDSQDVDANAFANANTATKTVPGTAGHLDEVSITLTNADSLAAGDFTIVYLARLSGDASDTATGDCEVIAVTLEYQT